MWTPISTILGSLLLHLSTATLLLNNGQVFDVSFILHAALTQPSLDAAPVLLGMVMGVMATNPLSFLLGIPFQASLPEEPKSLIPIIKTVTLGILMGWATKHEEGCMSNTLLCGIPQSFQYSATATLISFTTAVLTANGVTGNNGASYDQRHLHASPALLTHTTAALTTLTLSLLCISIILPCLLQPTKMHRALLALLSGFEYSLGLIMSGMASPEKVLQCLLITKPAIFDPSVPLVVIFAVLPNLARNIQRGFATSPSLADNFSLPVSRASESNGLFLAKNVAFGVGCGLSGVHVGSGTLRAVMQPIWGAAWVVGFLVGWQLP